MNNFTEFDLSIDIVIIVYVFCVKDSFLKVDVMVGWLGFMAYQPL